MGRGVGGSDTVAVETRATRSLEGGVFSLFRDEKKLFEEFTHYVPYLADIIDEKYPTDNLTEEEKAEIERAKTIAFVVGETIKGLDGTGSSPEDMLLAKYRLFLARDMIERSPIVLDLFRSLPKDYLENGVGAFDKEGAAQAGAVFQGFVDSVLNDSLSLHDLEQEAEGLGLELEVFENMDAGILSCARVGRREFVLAQDEDGVIYNVDIPPGIGSHHLQQASTSELLDLVGKMENVCSQVNLSQMNQLLIDLIDSSHMPDVRKKDLETIQQFVEKMLPYGANFPEDIRDTLLGISSYSNPSAADGCRARLRLTEALAAYGDFSHDLPEVIDLIETYGLEGHLGEEDRAAFAAMVEDLKKMKRGIDNSVGEEISRSVLEAKDTMRKYTGRDDKVARDVFGKYIRDENGNIVREPFKPSEYIHFQNFHDAVSVLDRSQGVNTAAVWSYLDDTFSNHGPDVWRARASRKLAKNEGEQVKHLTKIIYGSLLVGEDAELSGLFEESYAEEEDLRFRSRIQGKIPEKELIYLPDPYWAGREGESGLAGVHYSSDQERPSIVFLRGLDDKERRRVAVHELIHAGQVRDASGGIKNIPDENLPEGVPALVARSINEALTETLAQVRTNESFAQRTNSDNLPPCSYGQHVEILLQILDIAKIKQDDREQALDLLNSMTTAERIGAIKTILDKAGITEEPLTFWKNLLQESVGGNLSSLGSYFTQQVPSLRRS